MCASNGRFTGTTKNSDSTTTYHWFVSTPINNYNVTINIADYSVIERTYTSVNGDSIPFYFWVLPKYYETAVNHMDVFEKEFSFLESICGPYPFRTDKLGWAHTPYWGMEHQTIIAYGHNFSVNGWGYDYIHYHELAHEWWGNLITAKDWSDVWIHEGLATYMEALYVEHLSGREEYHQFMELKKPFDNHSFPLAPEESYTAEQAFSRLNSYSRGAAVMHTLRYHVGDDNFFKLLKHWAYPDSNDYDNTNGRLCRILSTEDMKEEAQEITGVNLNPFFNAFFRQASYPVLKVVRSTNHTEFTWETESSVFLDVDVPIRVNGEDMIVDMKKADGTANISKDDELEIDPIGWILMADPKIVTSTQSEAMANLSFSLEQNYPNPFNPETTINYSIPEKGFVNITVYNSLGIRVRTLVNEIKRPGIYQIKFDGSDLSSGIYFYKITTGGFSGVRKMSLIK
jgi:aminopeptidase N